MSYTATLLRYAKERSLAQQENQRLNVKKDSYVAMSTSTFQSLPCEVTITSKKKVRT